MTPKDIHKIFIPQKLYIFLKTLKGIEIQNFEPQNGASPRMNENIIVPPPPSTLSSQIETGAGGVQTQITEKTLIRVFFVGFFLQLYFFTVQRVETFIGGGGGGGGGATFYYYFFFFFGGGGLGGANPYFYRNLYNL